MLKGVECIYLKGILEVHVKKKGRIVEHWVDNNLVVDYPRTSIANALYSGATIKPITSIGIGTGQNLPTGSDTGLTGAYIKPVQNKTKPTPTSIQISFSILDTEANGMKISEFGLFDQDGKLFARKVRQDNGVVKIIDKTQDISIDGIWTIYI
ncbi:MAG: hypothetical protein PWQ97_434 [Tepidanaerobacteraceae bacterium]|nr:hypothetical protein [Tepidanaerobacteraceae bacterium]